MRCVFVSVWLVSIIFAGTVAQTDWSSGGGVQGPVSDWNDAFWSSDASIDFSGGKLELLYDPSPIEHTVAGDFSGASSVYSTDVDGGGIFELSREMPGLPFLHAGIGYAI